MQMKAERNISEYKKSLEKDIEKSALSLSTVILSKLNYKNSNAKQLREAGATCLVTGSFLYKATNKKEALSSLK